MSIVVIMFFNLSICMFFLFLSVLARFVLVPKLFCSDSEITHHLFSGFMKKKHAIVIGASNLCRIIKDSSHYKHIQILAESGGRHEYSSSSSSKQNFSKPTLDSLLFRALSRPGCQFVFIFPDILYNSLTTPPS